MSFQHKPNTGSLFKNDKREKETHPHAKGSCVIDGVEYWVSAWTNEKNGNKYQSLKFEPKNKDYTPAQENQLHREGAAQSTGNVRPNDDFDDDIPF